MPTIRCQTNIHSYDIPHITSGCKIVVVAIYRHRLLLLLLLNGELHIKEEEEEGEKKGTSCIAVSSGGTSLFQIHSKFSNLNMKRQIPNV